MATPEAEIMIHQPLGGVQGQASDIELVAQYIIRTKNRLNMILADVSGKPIETIARDTEGDYWLSADEGGIRKNDRNLY
jgi:ATP-dependent Clp protease, proteolytic subunit ClpP